MDFTESSIPDCFHINPRVHKDARGTFTKIYHSGQFKEKGLSVNIEEQYVTVSGKGVLRGLHFQVPPYQHTKLVTCLSGEVIDSIVDLRKGSPTYGRHQTFTLKGDEESVLYIPPGLAHGFYTLSDSAVMLYMVSKEHSPEHDKGILWNSVGIMWPDEDPVLSERDRNHPSFDLFETPFLYNENGRP